MKAAFLLIGLAAACLAQQAGASSQGGSPQAAAPQTGVWFRIDYLKIPPAQVDAYLKTGKNIQLPRVAKGQILDWSVYRVQFAGTKSEYNYVAVTRFATYDRILAGPSGDSEAVRTDILGMVASSGTINAPWLSVNFIKSNRGTEQDRQNDEAKRWKPIHDAQLKAGRKGYKGWLAAAVMWPGGAGVEYDTVSGDAYDAFGLPEEGGFETEVAEANRNTALHGVTVKRELWQRLATTY